MYLHVSLVKLSFQIVIGQIPTLECMLLGVCGSFTHILSCQVVSATIP
jgi:hypothetical protein